MIYDIDIYGVFVPAILVWGGIAFFLVLALHRLTRRLPVRTVVWHRPLFTLATYAVILHAVVLISSGWIF